MCKPVSGLINADHTIHLPEPRGSYWKPSKEHWPTGGPSRQLKRRMAILDRLLHKKYPGPAKKQRKAVRP